MTVPTRLAGLVVTGASLILHAPLLAGWLLSGHDVSMYLAYGAQMTLLFAAGDWLPSWGPDLNNGFGAAGLLFYPPLTHWLHGLLGALGLSISSALHLVALVTHLVSGATFFAWARSTRAPSVLPAALLYMAAPYRLLDLYERTALAEHAAFIFPPLALLAFDPARTARSRATLAALAAAGLLLTNTPAAVIFGAALTAWALSGAERRAQLPAAVLGAVVGLCVSSFAWVPQAMAHGFVDVDRWFGDNAHGFAPSRNTLFNTTAEDVAFNVRASANLCACFLLCVLARLGMRAHPGRAWWVMACAAMVLALPPAGALWDVLPVVQRLQFPWRTGMLMVLAAGAMTVTLSVRRAWALFALAALGALPFYARSLVPAVGPAPTAHVGAYPDPRLVALVFERRGPPPADVRIPDGVFPLRGITLALQSELAGNPQPALDAIRQMPAAVVEDPAAVVEALPPEPGGVRSARVRSVKGGVVVLHGVAAPGMMVAVDGVPVDAFREESTGLLGTTLAPGEHVVSWEWVPATPVYVARWTSLLALALGLAALALTRRSRVDVAGPR